ncbi:hypothetical protein [Bradyrhizobium sp. ARR65]|uniref:hypothetical protein n=1 Tax=Bradyrhizobium sp. ARR65 TaxID=1040989 RepID=UPI0004654F5C|nr:hypothetical protein [Bradyrhizobium sp. ARR65]
MKLTRDLICRPFAALRFIFLAEDIRELGMAASAKVLSRLSGINIDVETRKDLAIFSVLGLLASLGCALTYGLDISAGFF